LFVYLLVFPQLALDSPQHLVVVAVIYMFSLRLG